jgi:hypothetical protein
MSRQGQNVGRKIIAADIFARSSADDMKNCRQLARHACVCVLSINILSLTGQQTSSNLTGFKNLLGLMMSPDFVTGTPKYK